MPERKTRNPLALAVLTLLFERPMHPYEMARVMRERHKEESIKLNYGSLYTVVEGLERAGFIRAVESVREGRRPERTLYALTDDGRAEMSEWLGSLLRVPAKEYFQFAAGLALMGALPPTEVAQLLRQRQRTMELELLRDRAALKGLLRGEDGLEPLPRLFLLETEYELALREAELEWVRKLLHEIESGALDGLQLWADFHHSPRHSGPDV